MAYGFELYTSFGLIDGDRLTHSKSIRKRIGSTMILYNDLTSLVKMVSIYMTNPDSINGPITINSSLERGSRREKEEHGSSFLPAITV